MTFHTDAELGRLKAENAKLRGLVDALAEALAYHQEQTRPIHGTIVALALYNAALKERWNEQN
jgi:hypothetical protein